MSLMGTKAKAPERPYSFQDRFHTIQRIAIIYPEAPERLRIARYTLQHLYRLPELFEFLILLPVGSERPLIDVPHEYTDMNYQPTTEQAAEIRSKIIGFNPELLLQLEPKPSVKLEKFIKALDLPLKIGFGTEQSGLNVVYSQRSSGFYEKNLLNLISLLKLEM